MAGGGGAGKAPVVGGGRDALAAAGEGGVCAREPGGTGLAERIRGLLLDAGDEPVHADTAYISPVESEQGWQGSEPP